jgi:serine/threonine protein kinase
MARLRHPNVITVFDIQTSADRVFIAMELVHGGTLRGHVGDTRPWRSQVAMLEAAGRGLAAAHAAGVIHRDFKPDNVLVADDGTVRVADFGLASDDGTSRDARANDDDWNPTRTGAIAGTLAYLAPERVGGTADALADQFAFCVTAYGCRGRAAVRAPRRRARQAVSRARGCAHARPWTRLAIDPRVRAVIDRGSPRIRLAGPIRAARRLRTTATPARSQRTC